MPRSALRVLVLVLATVIASITLAACGSGDESSTSTGSGGSETSAAAAAGPESGTFRMGTQPWLGYGPWTVAQDQGIFDRNGLDVEITNFNTDDQINAAFAAGRLDGTNIATHSALRFAAAGLPIKIILLEDVSTTADAIIAGPDIGSIADLRGKRVAFEEGTTSDILLSYALSENGMSKDDIEAVPIPASDAGAAFIAGRVDAAVTYEPYLTAALREDPSARLLYTAGEDPGLVSDVFIVSEDTIENRPGQLVALARSWGDAIAAYRADERGSQALIERSVGADPGSLATAFRGVRFYDLAENARQLNGDFASRTIEDVKTAATDAGLLEGDVDTSDIIVASFVDDAVGAR